MNITSYTDGLTVADMDAAETDKKTAGELVRSLKGACTHIRFSADPDDSGLRAQLECEGFRFADRMYDLSINLRRPKVDFERFCRTAVRPDLSQGAAMKRIAHAGFTSDRRFYLTKDCSSEKAQLIMDAWIDAWLDRSGQTFVCEIHDELAGFICLKPDEKKSMHVHLAATEEKYRLAGVGASLYAFAASYSKEKGFHALKGYVSSRNLSALNLYFSLGAAIERVRDIYLFEYGG